mmetsp:Transcript_23512/g.75299  ORF Transcript_23512/g.75299 Transcript_23512/m.75299 type:complete len:328 (+) Transcript_23512:45-1028(+)
MCTSDLSSADGLTRIRTHSLPSEYFDGEAGSSSSAAPAGAPPPPFPPPSPSAGPLSPLPRPAGTSPPLSLPAAPPLLLPACAASAASAAGGSLLLLRLMWLAAATSGVGSSPPTHTTSVSSPLTTSYLTPIESSALATSPTIFSFSSGSCTQPSDRTSMPLTPGGTSSGASLAPSSAGAGRGLLPWLGLPPALPARGLVASSPAACRLAAASASLPLRRRLGVPPSSPARSAPASAPVALPTLSALSMVLSPSSTDHFRVCGGSAGGTARVGFSGRAAATHAAASTPLAERRRAGLGSSIATRMLLASAEKPDASQRTAMPRSSTTA